MATELTVTHGSAIKLLELVSNSEAAILDMLGLKLSISVLDNYSNEKTLWESQVYSLPGAVWRFGISGQPCLAFGTVLEVSDVLESTFEVGGEIENLGYVLIGALAVGCSRISGAPIVDDNRRFTQRREITGASFSSFFRLTPSEDTCSQIDRFVSKMRMNQANGAR